jgi:hypothetical protein
MTPVERIKQTISLADVVGRDIDLRRLGGKLKGRCPFHDDANPSFEVAPPGDPYQRWKCWSGCGEGDVIDYVMRRDRCTMPEAIAKIDSTAAAPPKKRREQPQARDQQTFASPEDAARVFVMRWGEPSGRYKYTDAAGWPWGEVWRWDMERDGRRWKEIRPIRFVPGGCIIGRGEGEWPLYGQHSAAGDPVVVVEGEKCVQAMLWAGLSCMTWQGGSSAPKTADWSPLAGRRVVIWPDLDPPGAKAADEIAGLLASLTPPAIVHRITPPSILTEGEDVADYIGRLAAFGDTDHAIRAKVGEVVAWPSNPKPAIRRGLCVIRADEQEPEEIPWLWEGVFPVGNISTIIGMPGANKSFVTCDMAARLSTGTPWPCTHDYAQREPFETLMINAEDAPTYTIIPRLMAHGADRSKVHICSTSYEPDKDGMMQEVLFSLDQVAYIEDFVREHPAVRMVVIDPIGSFITGTRDTSRDNQMRQLLTPLKVIAQRHNLAVITVLHTRKGASDHADHAAMGSVAFTGIARANWHLVHDREEKGRRLMLPGKCNDWKVAGGFAFSISGEARVGRIVWESDRVDMTANDWYQRAGEGDGERPERGPGATKVKEVEDWLRVKLLTGPKLVADIEDEAKHAMGFAPKTLRRAKESLGVVVAKTGGTGKGWAMSLRTDKMGG